MLTSKYSKQNLRLRFYIVVRTYAIAIIYTVAFTALLLMLSFGEPSAARAAPCQLPPRPTSALPIRPSSDPTLNPEQKDVSSGFEDSAYIALRVENATQWSHTQVQWQDTLGEWHDITGWQGTLLPGHAQVWWFGRSNFGTGPFRWLVYAYDEDSLLLTSEPFMLPATGNSALELSLSLTP